jgi:hypothetical protein
MESKSGLLTYGKDYMNTSVFLSGDDAPYEFSIDDNNNVHYVISYSRSKEWDDHLRIKEGHISEDGYFKVMLSGGTKNNVKMYMCTTDNHKVTWLDNYVTFEFNGIANEDPFDNKFKCVKGHINQE